MVCQSETNTYDPSALTQLNGLIEIPTVVLQPWVRGVGLKIHLAPAGWFGLCLYLLITCYQHIDMDCADLALPCMCNKNLIYFRTVNGHDARLTIWLMCVLCNNCSHQMYQSINQTSNLSLVDLLLWNHSSRSSFTSSKQITLKFHKPFVAH